MKKLIYNNISLIISFSILLFLVIYGHIEYKSEVIGINNTYSKYIEECNSFTINTTEYLNYCNNLLEDKYQPTFFQKLVT